MCISVTWKENKAPLFLETDTVNYEGIATRSPQSD